MYKIDMHVHTKNVSQCGHVEAEMIPGLYKKAGYNAIVITDHYYEDYFNSLNDLTWEEKIDRFLNGYYQALSAAEKVGINVLLGMELRFNDHANDYLVYGIDEKFLKSNKNLFEMGLEGFRKFVENMNILIYQAHPFRKGMIRVNPSLLDGVEIFNGNPRHDSANHLAYEFAYENGLRMIGGSDFHQLVDLGRGGIKINKIIKSSHELIIELLQNNSIEIIKEC